MTQDEAKKLLPLIEAYSRGAEIQFFDGNDWITLDDVRFDSGVDNYRVKPILTYHFFRNKKECIEEMKKHQPFGWIKEINGDYYYSINTIDSASIYVNDSEKVSYEDASINFRFMDGEIFGKLGDY